MLLFPQQIHSTDSLNILDCIFDSLNTFKEMVLASTFVRRGGGGRGVTVSNTFCCVAQGFIH